MADLTAAKRKKLPDSAYAIPSKREYPIPDLNHARLALAMVAKNGDEAEQAEVRKAVYAKFPQLDPANKKPNDRAKAGKI